MLFCFLLVATEEKAHPRKLKDLSNRAIETEDLVFVCDLGEESRKSALF